CSSIRLPPPPISTLFPYTTLFRSQNWEQAVELSKERWAQIKSFTAEEWNETEKSIVELKDKVVQAGSQNQERVAELMSEVKELQDRKSTRLNSSHVKISYAVFCLK